MTAMCSADTVGVNTVRMFFILAAAIEIGYYCQMQRNYCSRCSCPGCAAARLPHPPDLCCDCPTCKAYRKRQISREQAAALPGQQSSAAALRRAKNAAYRARIDAEIAAREGRRERLRASLAAGNLSGGLRAEGIDPSPENVAQALEWLRS